MGDENFEFNDEEPGVREFKVKRWVYGFVSEMRKKSPASIQKWVDSIDNTQSPDQPSTSGLRSLHETAENLMDCNPPPPPPCTEPCSTKNLIDNRDKEQTQDEATQASASTSDNNTKRSFSYHENLKEIGKQKINEICDRINIKTKKMEFKNLLSKTSLKFKGPESPSAEKEVADIIMQPEDCSRMNQSDNKENLEVVVEQDEDVEKVIKSEIPTTSKDSLAACDNLLNPKIGMIGRSSSENPNPIFKRNRLQDIGRSFSVQDNDIPDNKIIIDSTDNLIYDIDDESASNRSTNNLFPSLNTSTKSINSNNSNTSNSQNAISSQNNLSSLVKSVPLSPVNKLYQDQSLSESQSPRNSRNQFVRDCSFQSDSSHCSSVESLLEARKPDAEQILINLGFGPGPRETEDVLSKIPKRFLKPSQVKGVNTEQFLRQQQLALQIHENSVLGYRGLLGNSDIFASPVVAKILERFSINEKHKMHIAEVHFYNNLSNLTGQPSNFNMSSLQNALAMALRK